MTARNALGLGCGRRGHGVGRGDREPFAFPGTERQYAPDRTVDIVHSRIEVALDPAVTAITGTVTHTLRGLADGTTTVGLHAHELTIDAVESADGAALDYRHSGHDLTIELPSALAHGAETSVAVCYHGTPRRGIYFIHPDDGYPDKPHQAWTQGQDEDSRYWFPCFDHPTEKASSAVHARVPQKYTAISNGALVSKTDNDDGTATWHWKQEAEHSAYLVTLCVAEFEEVVLPGDGVPLTAYVPPGRGKDALRAFGRTREMIEVFEDRFGIAYPYEKYAQVVVEDFIFGGMENTSATTLIDVTLYDERAALDSDMDDLVAHELAHQWWGDLLTCRDWGHAWLNEGFATFSEVVWKEHHKGEEDAAQDRLAMLGSYKGEDAGEYRRPIVDRRFDEPIDLFDRHLYEKGALVLNMLRHELGADAFWRAVKTYGRNNEGASVVTEDLRVAVEAATGRNMDWFLDQWVYGAGHPDIKASWKYDGDARVLQITIKQTQKTDKEMVDAFRFSVDVAVHGKDGGVTSHRFDCTRRDHTFHVPLADAPDRVDIDPHGHVLGSWKVDQPAEANRKLLASDAPLFARVRAAQGLAEEPTTENIGALAGALHDASWPLAVEAAKALGGTRQPGAREALVAALGEVENPRSRRGVAAALGSFRDDAVAGQALAERLEQGDPSIFVEGAAAKALGETRHAGARALLESVLADRESWGDVIRVGAIHGLAALGSEAVLPAALEATRYGKPARVRAAATRALAVIGRRMAVREPVLEALAELLTDPDFRVVMSTIAALRHLGDDRGIGVLHGAPALHADGRVKRAVRAAVMRLRKSSERSNEVSRLSDDLETMRKQNAELLERMSKLEARLHGGDAEDGTASSSPA